MLDQKKFTALIRLFQCIWIDWFTSAVREASAEVGAGYSLLTAWDETWADRAVGNTLVLLRLFKLRLDAPPANLTLGHGF